jgi:hypothetical protein
LTRGQRIVATQVTGAAVFAMGGGLLSVPVGLAGGLWFDRVFNQAGILLVCPYWKPNDEGCPYMEKLKSGAQLSVLLKSQTGRKIL